MGHSRNKILMAAEFLIVDDKAGAMSQEPGTMEISNFLLNLANKICNCLFYALIFYSY